jgi:23S rRNA (guanine2445-N2)-methyltransferase / 23S rRNA (guanine2069-N7)-methyltransferase
MSFPLDLIATTAFGLESIARRELAALGYEGKVTSPGRILFRGDLAAICRTNLWLRTADRILVQVATFPAEDFEALFERTKAANWNEWISADSAFPVVGRSIKSQLSSVPACQRAVKKAVVESLLAAHRVEQLPETGPLYRIEVALLKNQVTLTIDTTGPSLHKRGYRQFASRAPLKETLASAMVLLSFWNGERPMIDPFCGSGTIPIEAALIGRNMAPGLHRSFTANSWPNISPTLWEEAQNEARDLAVASIPERIVGTDIDSRVLDSARQNAELAGVSDTVHFQQRAFEQLTSKRQFGCLIANPPYGHRLHEYRDLEGLYRSIPTILRKLPTWSHYILTAFPVFENLLEKKADRRRKLYNGRIECTYYQYHGPRPGDAGRAPAVDNCPPASVPSAGAPQAVNDSSAICSTPSVAVDSSESKKRPLAPVFGGLTEKSHEQADLFRRRLEKRARHLRRWPTQRGITCFRLYDRDIPEIPLVVDRYEDHLHIGEFERPHDRDGAQHADWLDLMLKTAGKALGVDRQRIFLKHRRRQRGTDQHEHFSDRHEEARVGEGGLQFIVNLSDYVDTGLFLDHRITRGMVRDAAEGKRVLNLFGYTGTFSVYAADGGATSTVTVDWSRSYLEWTQRNLSLNGFSMRQHRIVRSDAREYLRQLPLTPVFDLAIVDPPTFSNNKGNLDDWSIQDHYAELINDLIPRMSPGGTIFFSTNFRRFKLDADAIAASNIREISKHTVPEDFRNRRIHRCWRITL